MHFAKLLFIGSTFVVATFAQAKIAFTTLPASVRAGEPITLKWAGGDNSPVTLTLKQGSPDDLQTVAIITGKATGNSYTWTPSKSLPNGDNYALQISQGADDVNYSGEFALSGGSASVATTALSSASSASSASITSAASLSSAVASLNNTVSSIVASVSNSTNGTAGTTTTALTPAGTGAVGSGASGASAVTGTALHRNTTMSHATLTSSKSASSTATSTSGGSGSSTAGTSSAPSSSPSSDAMRMASPLALVLGAFAAIVYLG